MLDVIAFLIAHFQDFDACPPREDLGEILERAGFEEEDIGGLLWFLDVIKMPPLLPPERLQASRGLRVYAADEQDWIPTEVHGLLHFLEQNGAIRAEQRELILHVLLCQAAEDLDLQHAKLVTLLVLWVQKSELPVLLGMELMSALHGQETLH